MICGNHCCKPACCRNQISHTNLCGMMTPATSDSNFFFQSQCKASRLSIFFSFGMVRVRSSHTRQRVSSCLSLCVWDRVQTWVGLLQGPSGSTRQGPGGSGSGWCLLQSLCFPLWICHQLWRRSCSPKTSAMVPLPHPRAIRWGPRWGAPPPGEWGLQRPLWGPDGGWGGGGNSGWHWVWRDR